MLASGMVAAQNSLLYNSERANGVDRLHSSAYLTIPHKLGCLFPQDPHSQDADERAVGAAPLKLIKGRPIDAVLARRSVLETRAPSDG